MNIFSKIKSKLRILSKQRAFVNELLKKGGEGVPFLQNRNELKTLLGGPALINDPEVPMLQKYASLAPELIVEIGCAYGGSSLLFMLQKKYEARLVSIDPFIKDSMGEFQASYRKCHGFVSSALRKLGLKDRVSKWDLVSDYSFNIVKSWTKPIDLIFIDGDHTYEAVKQDFEEWYPHVKAGGVILFHDSARPIDSKDEKADHGWPGPSRLVRELKNDSRVEFLEQVYSVTAFKKNV